MGFVFQALGSLATGNATQQADNYNAQVARQNAAYSTQAGEVQSQNVSLRGAAMGGRIKAAQAANNVTLYQPGKNVSTTNVQKSERMATQASAINTDNNALITAYGYKAQSSLDIYAGKTAMIGGELGAAGDIAGGLTQLAGVPTSVPGGGAASGASPSLGPSLQASASPSGYDYEDLASIP